MKSVLFTALLLICSALTFGQSLSDTIHVKRSLGVVFSQHGVRLKPRDLMEITRSNPEAYKEMQMAKSNYNAGQVFGTIGGALIGWPLGTALGGGKPNWALAAVGGGLVLISIPFSSSYSKHSMKAVSIYNNDLQSTGRNSVRTKLGLTATGLRIEIKL